MTNTVRTYVNVGRCKLTEFGQFLLFCLSGRHLLFPDDSHRRAAGYCVRGSIRLDSLRHHVVRAAAAEALLRWLAADGHASRRAGPGRVRPDLSLNWTNVQSRGCSSASASARM